MEDVVLNGEILVDEVGAVGVVGMDAADTGGGHEDVVGLFGLEEVEGGALVEQVELLPGTNKEIGVAGRLQAAQDGRTHHTAMAGDIDF